MRVRGLAVLIAVAAFGLGAPAFAEVRVTSDSPCVDPATFVARLEALLQNYAGGAQVDLQLALEARAERERTVLTVLGTDLSGERILDRRFELEVGSCPSALALVETVVEASIRELPLEAWTRPAPPAPPPPVAPLAVEAPVDDRWGWRIVAGPSVGVLDLSGGLELGVSLRYGGQHGLAVGARGVFSMYGRLGPGRPLTQLGLLEGAWSMETDGLATAAGLRSGLLIATGVGYAEDDVAVAFWWEAFGRITFTFGALALGPELVVGPQQHLLSTRAGLTTRVSPLRLGLVLVF